MKARENFLTLIYFIAYWSGIVSIFYAVNRRRTRILSYHSVLPDDLYDNSLHLGVSHRLSDFERQLAVVRARFRVSTHLLDEGACVVTFDDGYKNNLLAAQLLERHGLRGLFFVPIRPLTSRETLVIDRVLMWFSYVAPGKYSVGSQDVVIGENGRGGAYGKFYAWMLNNVSCWNDVPNMLEQASSFSRLPVRDDLRRMRFEPMTAEDLEALQVGGHELGCHSWDHRPLAALGDTEIREDFDRCDAARQAFGMRAYCYPFGGKVEVSERVISECEARGYEWAVLNMPTNPFSHSQARFALPRISLPQEANRYVLEARLCGIDAALRRLFGRDDR